MGRPGTVNVGRVKKEQFVVRMGASGHAGK
jgi:hypothetical protein